MALKDKFIVVWYAEYMGIGYLLDDEGWHVFPLFRNSSDAKKIWDEYIEQLDEKNLRMRFIELDGEYEFILYAHPFFKEKPNFGFFRHLDSSEYYKTFKQKSQGKAFFRFGVFRTGEEPIIFQKSKLVTDIKFMKSHEVAKNSIEWTARESQRRAKKRKGYTI